MSQRNADIEQNNFVGTDTRNLNEIEILSVTDVSSNYKIEIHEEFQQVKNRKKKKSKTNLEETKKTKKPNNPNIKNAAISPIELKNRFNGLEIQSDKTINSNISPVSLKKTANYKQILQRIIDFQKIKCRAKPFGEFLQLFCETEKNHRPLTEYLDTQKFEYFVIPSQADKLTKVVIRGMHIDTSCEEIQEELTKKDYGVHKIHQLKKFRTKAPMPLFQV
ncbi:hypothetical protein AVEN_30840-1 [Araneus ventricosus]|uniref:Pre-C2HC domain-containing protein n=1 Tax=Araneus ventricosus TaxID=182803 RepID=A0A4Y2QZ60_ARAVE|nr:hypothetical protein AVEN_30840-1 [Araneus ventricosus]